jgi:nitronate monooxygenase
MSLLETLKGRLSLPVIGSPLFIVSVPDLVVAQCTAGIIGSMPSLNARPAEQFEEWVIEIKERLAAHDARHPDRPSAPFAINLIVHKSNDRLDHDLAVCVKQKVPLIISSLGARDEVNHAVHGYGGHVLHDVINQKFAHKAIEKGADGLVLVCAGAGGHAGALSPFGFVQETRAWFDGPIALSGAIANGRSILAAEAIGADFGYIGSAFIATREARALPEQQQMILDCGAEDIVYTNLITGVHGNYMKPSLKRAGLDPENLPTSDPSQMSFGTDRSKRRWKEIWGAGQGIGVVQDIPAAGDLVARLRREYHAARARLGAGCPMINPAWEAVLDVAAE